MATLFGTALGSTLGMQYIDEAQEITAQQMNQLYVQVPEWQNQWYTTTTTDTSAAGLTVEDLRAEYIHQQYPQTIQLQGVYGSFLGEPEPEPEPKVEPITDFSKWLLKKYNTV